MKLLSIGFVVGLVGTVFSQDSTYSDVYKMDTTEAKPEPLSRKIAFPPSALDVNRDSREIATIAQKLKKYESSTSATPTVSKNKRDAVKEAKLMRNMMTNIKALQEILHDLDESFDKRDVILVFETPEERAARLALIDNYKPVERYFGEHAEKAAAEAIA